MPRAKTPGKDRFVVGPKVKRWLTEQQLRNARPSNQTELADELEIDQTTVSSWIQKGTRPRSDILRRLAQLMGVKQEWLTSPGKDKAEPDDMSVDALLAEMSPQERAWLVKGLQQQHVRRAVVEVGRAAESGGSAEPPSSGRIGGRR